MHHDFLEFDVCYNIFKADTVPLYRALTKSMGLGWTKQAKAFIRVKTTKSGLAQRLG
jgi:hypothetical protein